MENLNGQAKNWDYTCTFCSKPFPSAQALGGHQNAHRRERREEKKLFIKDPVEYRKRAFLRSFRPPETIDQPSSDRVYVDFLPIQFQTQQEVRDWNPMSDRSLDLNMVPPMESNGKPFDGSRDDKMDLNLKL